jgi:hypothetical protein
MKRVSTTFGTLISVLMLTLGLYLLKEGIANKTWLAPATLIMGAAFFALGFITLYFAIKSVLSHRARLGHVTGGRRLRKAVSSHNDRVRGRLADTKTCGEDVNR